jgi:hypothetical protein
LIPVGILPFVSTYDASAYPRLNGNCFSGTKVVSWRFEDFGGLNWDPNQAAAFRVGAEQWDTYLDKDGSTSVTGSAESPFGSLPVRRTVANVNQNVCSSAGVPLRIEISETNLSRLRTLGRHEIGHAMKLAHSGQSDSQPFDGSTFANPAMDACFGDVDIPLRLDDTAQASSRWDTALNANGGFENSFAWQTGTGWSYGSGGAARGNRFAAVANNGTISSAPVRYTTPKSTLNVRTGYKSSAAVKFKFQYRVVNYGAADGTDCGSLNYNPNSLNWASFSVGDWATSSWDLPARTGWGPEVRTVPSPTPNGFTPFEGIDMIIQVWAPSSTASVDNLEII